MVRSRAGRLAFLLLALGAAAAGGTAYVYRLRHQTIPGAYEQLARKLNEAPRAERCDEIDADRRRRLARILDRFGPRIHDLFQARVAKDFPKDRLEAVGPVFLRVNEGGPARAGFEVSDWSWEEAQGTYLRTQTDAEAPETKERWRDFYTMLRYLLEKDAGRLFGGQLYLPPRETLHHFRPHANVERTGPRELTVTLRAVDFAGAEAPLAALFQREWSQGGWRLRVRFAERPDLYALRANFRSSRSFVNHAQRALVIANYAFTRTLAHELGHVLGFDDHYYSVWHKENCYYTQESRRNDLMSNSDQGRVTAEHWRLLDRAYPWRKPRSAPFAYRFGD